MIGFLSSMTIAAHGHPLSSCAQTLSATRFVSGAIVVNNEEDAQYTVVHIGEGRERTAALLDVASAMTGVGCIIHEAVIQARRRNPNF